MNFHYVNVLLDMLYGIELEDETIEELGLLGWNLIGNRNVRLYRCSMNINPIDNSITLPCNALDGPIEEKGIVEAVTASYEDWAYVTNYSEIGDNKTSYIENKIESEKYYLSLYYIPGKLLKYKQSGDKLYFSHNYGKVNILYKGIVTDDDGLPELTEKEANAIATYIAYITKYKEGLITNNTVIINLAKSLKNDWLQLCDLARITYLNLNDMNNILEIKNSWDRSGYGRSYKPIR